MMSASITAQNRRLTTNATTSNYLCGSAPFAQAKVLPPGERYGLAGETDFHAHSHLAATNHRELPWLRGRGQQLVVLPERQILVRCAGRERNPLEFDHTPTAGAHGEMPCIQRKAVGEVEHRVGGAGELDPLGDPERWTHVALLAEGRTGRAERAGNHELVSRKRARAAGHVFGTADSS